ncbi:hypothetical protein ACT8ZR_09225 [Neobacillus sp. M.A.Huq-85]
MERKDNFVLELDNEPALVFVQENLKGGFKVFQDGKEVKGIRNIKIYASYDGATTHEIEFLTGATK